MAGTAEIAFDRDGLARWYAKRHLDTDAGVMQIHYLPAHAPAQEIRFLEVNHLISETTPLEPIDFGVDIGGSKPHTLNVLDLTPAQYEAICSGALALPGDWSLEGTQTYSK